MPHSPIDAISRPSSFPAPGRFYGACAVFLGVFVFSLSVQAWSEAIRRADPDQSPAATATTSADKANPTTTEAASEWRSTERYLTRWQLLQLTIPAVLAAIVSGFFARGEGPQVVPPPPKFDAKMVTEATGLPLLASLFPSSTKIRSSRVKYRAGFVRWTVFSCEVLICTALVVAGIAAVSRPPIGRQLLVNPFHGYAQAVELAQRQWSSVIGRIVRNPTASSNSR